MENHLLQFAKTMRSTATDVEKVLWRQLRAGRLLDHKFKQQQPIGNYIADFVCFERRLIVEADGGQHADNGADDAARTEWLQSQGFRVLRFWNNDILTRHADVLESIIAALEAPVPPTAVK